MAKFKFAHMADCHIGGWREPKLHDAAAKAFSKATDICIEEDIDFAVIAGDLFNNAIPSIENLKSAISDLKKLNNQNIPVYIVAGSHDFSSSGKTIIDALERAGLVINLVKGDIIENKLKLKFTNDIRTGAKLAGMIGKKGMLEKRFYDALDYSIEREQGFKIFVYHSAITEMLPKELKDIDSMSSAILPNGFDYYAGGHVHIISNMKKGDANIVFPGPLFPNSFAELEKLEHGGFYIVDVEQSDNNTTLTPVYKKILIHNYAKIDINCDNKTPAEINDELEQSIKDREFFGCIVTIRLHGLMKSGKPSEVKFDNIFSTIYGKGAYLVMRSTTQLDNQKELRITANEPGNNDIENEIIANSIKNESQQSLTRNLIKALSSEKLEGEKKDDYDARITEDIKHAIENG